MKPRRNEPELIQTLRQVSPGWASVYAGAWTVWMALSLPLRWTLAGVFVAVRC